MSFIEQPSQSQPLPQNETNTEVFIAKSIIQKGQAVCFSPIHGIEYVVKANSNDATLKNHFAGIATQNAAIDDQIEIQMSGEYEDLTASWVVSDKQLYYDHLGSVVKDPPVTATHYQIIGSVLTATKMIIAKEPAVNA